MAKRDLRALFQSMAVTPTEARVIRVGAGLSQSELANILLCSTQRVKDWENGRSCKVGYLTGGDSIVLRIIEVYGLDLFLDRSAIFAEESKVK